MVTGTTRYRRSWETIAKWYNVMHLLSLPYHVTFQDILCHIPGQVCMYEDYATAWVGASEV